LPWSDYYKTWDSGMVDRERHTARWFRVQAIGHVRRPGADELDPVGFYDPTIESALEILPRWSAALTGIESFSHLIVLFWLDRARRVRAPRQGRPEGRSDLPSVGLFATRTPHRPNPIGIATPQLIRRDQDTLWVSGIDAWPGTPIIDLKGYAPRDDLHAEATVPEWLTRLWAIHDAERRPPLDTNLVQRDRR
jgi:tRNA-Thr(GGU) m(6)t(6)A37 methyltransferase TsaA